MTRVTDSFDHRDPWHQVLLLVFYGSVSMLWFYSISRWTNLINSLQVIYNDWGKTPLDPVPGEYAEEPIVTVQIATYNEGTVVGDTIARACALDWPRDKLFIQVCDDSTEKESIAIIENLILSWREKGFNVERLFRHDRIGYKAGNLQHNFQFIKGDYVAYLDADHMVEPQFLRRTIPHFYDENGKAKTHIGLVQTPWCYYNTHQNLLTECDALGLDIHHVIEQVGRCCSYNMFGFNGTGGVWRKQAVEDAGGFSWDTVTEDLLLSYKAHLEGYEFVYVRDAPQALEVPSCILAHVQQKQRWTKGFMQVLRMYYTDILFSKQATFAVKLEALMHLSGPLQLVAAMTALLAYPYLVFHKIDSFLVKIVSILALTEPVAAAIHAVVSKIPGENGHYTYWHSKVARLLTILPYFALRFGMTPFETKAIFEGFFSDDATFHTTPKEGSNSTVPAVKRAKKVVRTGGDDMAAGVGLFLAIHQFIYVFAFDMHMPCHTVFDVVVRALNLLICIGLFTVSIMFFLAKHPSLGQRAIHSLANTRHVFLSVALLAYTVGYMTCFMSSGEIDFSIIEKHPINNTMFASTDDGIVLPSKAFEVIDTVRPLACRPKVAAKPFSSVVALGLPRTGSTLMFNFLTELGKHYPNIDNLSLFETFAPVATMQLPGLTQIVDILRKNCDGLEPGAKTMFQQRFDFQSEHELYEYLRKDEHPEIYEPLIAAHSNRYKDPLSWLHYVESIPSTGDYGYVEYKVFDHDMLEIGISSPELIDSMHSPNTKFVINYRRNLLESYVSQKIAEASGNWVGAKTTSDDAITINRQEFEDYIKAKVTYFQEIRDHLDRKNIPYSVFEYNTHLGAEPQQRDTLRHLQKLLRLRIDDSVVEDIMAGLRRKKQSTVPVREQIRNWDEVVQWGLGKEKDEDWEDLFASVDNSKALVAYEPPKQLACKVGAPAKPMSSVIALGLPRTGSTLMFNFLTELGKHYPNIDNLSLFETFAPVATMQLPGLTQIVDILRKNCDGLEPGAKTMFQQRFDFQSEQELYEYLRKDEHPEIYEPLIAAHSNRYKDPLSWLHYVESIPSTGDYGYVEYKVFDHDMLEIGISSPELIDSMHSPNTKFVINYRRNLLESYVSQKIAEASGNWVGAKTTSDDAITINRQEFEDYIKAKVTYFQEIRDHLDRKNIPYSVFEYNTHLGAEPQQRDTLRHLQKLLRLRIDDSVVEDIMAGLRRKKQSTVPVREQIRNWDEVVQWGLGKEKDEDWEDLFASVDNSKALVAYEPPKQLACKVGAPAKPMSSVIALGLPRTGSTLMFNFLTELGKHYPNIDNLSLFETFAPVATMQLPGLTQIVDILRKNCDGLEPGAKTMFQQRFDFQSEQELYEYLRKDEHPEIYEPLIAAHSNRYKDPLSWLHYVESIPSTGDYGYVEYKVFDHDMLEIGISSPELIDSMHSPNTKFVINYRRNLLESYVSQKIAEASGNWVGAKTTSDDAITINRQEFEDYIKAKVTYFQEIRDHLDRKNIPYSVFEYNTHLGAEPQQRDTLRHLQKLLRLRIDDSVVEDIMAGLRRKKQSTVPVREQIRNWDEVVQWGLGKEKDEDWEDLFASVDNSKALVAYEPPKQLACKVGAPAKPMSSVIALGLPRTGSTLMFNFLTELGKHYPNIDNLSLFETFAPVATMQLPGLTQIVDILRKNCDGLEPGEKTMFQQRFDFQSEQELYEYLRKDEHPEIYEPLIAAHSNRYKDPLSWLHYVESIPSTGDYGYVEYKVFDHDMLEIGISSPELIDSMHSPNTKFVINYRRNLLESYVSQKIAEASGNWVGAKTTSDDAITINRQEFEDYIKAKVTYFQEIREHLDRKRIPYSIFEYNTHLGAEPQQRDTLRHLQKLLRLRVDDTIVEDIMANLRRKKQSTVPVREQIRNWEEVVQWGLGKEKDEDWDDLFAGASEAVSF